MFFSANFFAEPLHKYKINTEFKRLNKNKNKKEINMVNTYKKNNLKSTETR